MIKFKKQFNKAFTLIESMVAISIFTTSVLGMLTLTAGNISNTNYAKNKLMATFLAQEGLEYVRNLRDDYTVFVYNGFEKFQTKVVPCTTPNGCYFNADLVGHNGDIIQNIVLTECSSGVCPFLRYDENSYTKQYNYTTGNLSNFSRKLKIEIISTSNPAQKEVKVTSMVTFNLSGKSHTVYFTSYLNNWAEYIL